MFNVNVKHHRINLLKLCFKPALGKILDTLNILDLRHYMAFYGTRLNLTLLEKKTWKGVCYINELKHSDDFWNVLLYLRSSMMAL